MTLRQLLAAAVKRDGRSAGEIEDYELVVRRAGESDVLMTLVSVQ